jgi:predicted oxidoreductase (fatty acid repression mutant protein)
MAADGLLKLMTERRSFYPLKKEIPVTPKRVMEIVKTAVHQTPSSFNSQSNRVLVLFGTDHERLWDITAEDLRAVVPADLWDPTGKKITMSKAAAGTVRFLAFPLPPSF